MYLLCSTYLVVHLLLPAQQFAEVLHLAVFVLDNALLHDVEITVNDSNKCKCHCNQQEWPY